MTETTVIERHLAEGGEAMKKAILDMIPLGRFGKPEESRIRLVFMSGCRILHHRDKHRG